MAITSRDRKEVYTFELQRSFRKRRIPIVGRTVSAPSNRPGVDEEAIECHDLLARTILKVLTYDYYMLLQKASKVILT